MKIVGGGDEFSQISWPYQSHKSVVLPYTDVCSMSLSVLSELCYMYFIMKKKTTFLHL